MATPELSPFGGDWAAYEDEIYEVFLDTFVRAGIKFQGVRVGAQFGPETRKKGYSFWHVISTAPDPRNRNEDDRIPDLRRCERIRWIAWAIENADADGFKWWEVQRGRDTHVVIWTEEHDFAVVLAKRNGYYVLKTAYAPIREHQRQSFERDFQAYKKATGP